MFDARMPEVLLGEGDRPDAFDAPRIAIVGTRAATPMGIADATEIAAFCARAGITVVSGLAIGIDGAAHTGALDAGGLTVGVVATGLDVTYPRRHARLYERVREQGVIVGENPYGTQPLPWRFPIRNRIIAALADAVVVVEATRTGGACITANEASRFDRDVYVAARFTPESRRRRLQRAPPRRGQAAPRTGRRAVRDRPGRHSRGRLVGARRLRSTPTRRRCCAPSPATGRPSTRSSAGCPSPLGSWARRCGRSSTAVTWSAGAACGGHVECQLPSRDAER